MTSTFRRWSAAIAVAVIVAACSSTDTSPQVSSDTAPSMSEVSTAPTSTSTETVPPTVESTVESMVEPSVAPQGESPFIDDPYLLVVPDSAQTSAEPLPLVILLHGYGATAEIQLAYFGLEPLARERGFLLAVPDGATNAVDRQYWNATDACCGGTNGQGEPDHVALLELLIDDVASRHPVDPDRVYMIGHSNGGFMSYRMACDASDRIAAIVSLAGSTWADQDRCSPQSPVSVLQIHGDADDVIRYEGGDILGAPYPSAAETTRQWARLNQCSEPPSSIIAEDPTVDLEATIESAETSIFAVSDCPAGVDVELWTINGGSHIPGFTPEFASATISFLLSHPKVRS
jgi:polyhydroxybutyrate depolymerase